MKYLCMTSSNRTDYIDKVLDALSVNDRRDWRLLVAQEPTGAIGHVRSLIRQSGGTHYTNPRVLGPDANVWGVCSKAMSYPTCEAVLYMDDDVVLSPDALTLCNWYLALPPKPEYAGICLCNSASDPTRPCSISIKETWRGHVGQGHFFTRAEWDNFVRPNFHAKNPKWDANSYDWALGMRVQELNRIFLRPRLSRAQHIGLVGLHGRAAGAHTEIFPKDIATAPCNNFVIE